MNKNKIQEAKYVVGDPNAAITLASTNKLQKTDTVVVDKNAAAKASLPLEEENDVLEPEAVIAPQDNATIKYLSNIKDEKTGEISQPFTIGTQKYQMVRGMAPDKQIVMAVYCHDEKDEMGNNRIHQLDHFEKTIALPMLEKEGKTLPIKEEGYAEEERGYNDKEAFIDYLNLSDLPGYKHFFVNIRNGKVNAKFRTTKEMIKSGIKLGPDEDYMDAKTLKKFRFGDYFKSDINEEDTATGDVDVKSLQTDVKKLGKLIKDKFSVALSKLNKPIEQVQFLTAMAAEIGIPLNKLSTLMTSFKDIANTNAAPAVSESKVMTKNQLLESIKPKTVIKTIKVKDIK